MSSRLSARDVSESLGKLPPQAPDIEEIILGALINEARLSLPLIVDSLKPSSFYSDQHKEIYSCILAMHMENEPIELRTIVHRLRITGKLEIIGGAYYISKLSSKSNTSSNIVFHSKILIEMAMKRDLIQIASQIHHDAYEDTTDAFELLEKAKASIQYTEDSATKSRTFVSSSYLEPDLSRMTQEWNNGVQTGEKSGIDDLDDVFKWMRGHQNGWYGWANAGKGTTFDFMAIVKAKRDDWKFGMFKQEDMSSDRVDKKTHISGNKIYNNMVWSLTGRTPFKHFAEKYHIAKLPIDEYIYALEFVQKHMFIIYPSDRRYKRVFDTMLYYHEKFGFDGILIDPFKSLILDDGERGDERLTKVFIASKEIALTQNINVSYINHPKTMFDVKEKNGTYKVVTQHMQLGGSAWDINMDAQYSIYRPEVHLSPNDPKVHFINLKQRDAEIVGCNKGVYENMRFDFLKKQFYFNGVNPIDGSLSKDKAREMGVQTEMRPLHTVKEPEKVNDDMPF